MYMTSNRMGYPLVHHCPGFWERWEAALTAIDPDLGLDARLRMEVDATPLLQEVFHLVCEDMGTEYPRRHMLAKGVFTDLSVLNFELNPSNWATASW